MRQQSRTVASIPQVSEAIAGQRHLPLVDLLIDTRAELLELTIGRIQSVLARSGS